jgi:hypothetical protein
MTTQPDLEQQRYAARAHARRAIHDLAIKAGARIITRPLFPGANAQERDVDPLAGLAASRRLEIAVWQHTRDYVRAAREAGHSWRDIGTALDRTPGSDLRQAGQTAAEAAFNYAAGDPQTEHARRYGRPVAWHCGSCDRTISDHGLCNGPVDDERGHAGNCPRLAATIATHDAECEAFDAEWEAGR